MFPLLFLYLLALTLLSAAYALISIRICVRFGILDIPGQAAHKLHDRPTPLAGGLVLVFSLLTVAAGFRDLFSQEMDRVLVASLIIFAFGLIDDIQGKGAIFKLLGQLCATTILIALGIQVSIVALPSSTFGNLVNLFFTVFWLVGITNAFNLIDGADGLASGLSLVASLSVFVGAIIAGQFPVAYFSLALIVITSVILIQNRYPAKLFLGDSGAQMFGFLVAALGIAYNPEIRPQSASWFVPITFVLVPIFDVCLVFFSRLHRKKPLFQADRNHTHHRLVARGMTNNKAVLTMCAAQMFCSLVGLIALYSTPLVANILFLGLLMSGVYLFFALERNWSF